MKVPALRVEPIDFASLSRETETIACFAKPLGGGWGTLACSRALCPGPSQAPMISFPRLHRTLLACWSGRLPRRFLPILPLTLC